MVRPIAVVFPGCLPSRPRLPAKSLQSLTNYPTRSISFIVSLHLPSPGHIQVHRSHPRFQTHTTPYPPSLGVIRFAANETAADTDSASVSAIDGLDGPTIPWKISNKYYAADVHFENITIDKYLSRRNEFDGAPAVLFVWNRGQVCSEPSPPSRQAHLPVTHHICGASPIFPWHSPTENTLKSSLGRLTRWTRRLSSPSNSQRTSPTLQLPPPPPRRMMTRRWTSLSLRMGSSLSMGTTRVVRGSWIQMMTLLVSSLHTRSTHTYPCHLLRLSTTWALYAVANPGLTLELHGFQSHQD